MNASAQSLGLPLLGKELIEQAARRRTYIVRTVYAVLLFGFAILILSAEVYGRSSNQLDILGRGKQMFFFLYMLEVFGILLFTPALTCTAITSEKERNTFGLLLLTRLGPTTILLEKYLSRVILMSTFVLISLPLLGFCYALGGLEQEVVWAAFFTLIVTVLQLSALGICCSCVCRTTVGAFIASYLLGILMLFGPAFCIEALRMTSLRGPLMLLWMMNDQLVELLGGIGTLAVTGLFQLFQGDSEPILGTGPVWATLQRSGPQQAHMLLFLFFAPFYVLDTLDSSFRAVIPWRMYFSSVPALMTAVFWLLLARLAIVSRAFAPPRRYLIGLFRILDRLFERINHNRVTKGIVLINSSNRLPGVDPVAWRETTKSPLGTVQYLIRIFLSIEFPVAALCLLVLATETGSQFQYTPRHPGLTGILTIVWLVSILLVSVKGATLIAGERSRETLDVLLSTPIDSRDLIRQKFAGVRRLIAVLLVPLFTVVLSQAWKASLHGGGWLRVSHDGIAKSALAYFIVEVTTALIMLPLIAWMSFLISLWVKTSTKAIFLSLALIAAWIVLPFPVVISCFELFGIRPGDWRALCLITSPAAVPVFTEVGEIDDLFRTGSSMDLSWIPLFIHITSYTALLLLIRHVCLACSGTLLGRGEREQ